MAAPTIPVSADSFEGNSRDTIDIGVDVIQPVLVALVVFPAATVMMTLAQHEEAIRGIQEHLLGVPIQEETTKAVETVTRNHERFARIEIERQLALVQESHCQDQEDFKKLKEFVTLQFGHRS
ncbi:hypothetical protein Tco_0174985 [Tanacetum coccineum]